MSSSCPSTSWIRYISRLSKDLHVRPTLFGANPLYTPDCKGMGRGAGPADIDEGAKRQERIGGDLADPALSSRLRQHLGKVSALESPYVIALPDMVVTIGIERQICPALF